MSNNGNNGSNAQYWQWQQQQQQQQQQGYAQQGYVPSTQGQHPQQGYAPHSQGYAPRQQPYGQVQAPPAHRPQSHSQSPTQRQAVVPRSPGFTVLPQEPYASPSHTTTTPALDQHPIVFRDVNTHRGVRARDMLNGAFQNLENATVTLPLPAEIRSKITIRFHPRGYKAFSKPKYIRETDANPITYSRMAQRIAEVVNEFIELPETKQTTDLPPDAVRLGPDGVGFDNLFIECLLHKSRGSFQPEITIYSV